MYDIIIIGAGPAGLTAAIYACRASKKVLVLEKKMYGGQIVNTLDIENYPCEPHISGFDFATKLYNQAKDLGMELVYEEVISINGNGNIKEVATVKNTYRGKTIIIATGSYNRKLGIQNEEAFIGRGISYCATCDGAFYKDKVVSVVGGGNTALEDALYLSDIAKKVYLIHRNDKFKADDVTVNKLKDKPNVEIICNSNIVKLNGDDKLSSIEVDTNGNTNTILIDGLFIAIGRIPETTIFNNLIKLNTYGYIESSERCHTNIDGVFVAGDNREKEVRQLVTATSDGAIAATEAIKYINNNDQT